MVILTTEQMRFIAWQTHHTDYPELLDCLAVWADLDAEQRANKGEAQ